MQAKAEPQSHHDPRVATSAATPTLLMAAGYTIKELMEYMGHADLQMVNRYVKLLPQPGETDAADASTPTSVAPRRDELCCGRSTLVVASRRENPGIFSA